MSPIKSYIILTLSLPLSFNLSHFRHEEADLVTVEFGDRGDSVDVPQEVVCCAQEGPERRLAIAPTEQMALRGDDHFHQPRRSPVFTEQAAQDRLEVVAHLDRPQFAGTVLANIFWLPNSRLRHFVLQSFPADSFILAAPHRHSLSVPLALPKQRRAGSQQQVPPHQGVGERLLVRAEQREDAA